MFTYHLGEGLKTRKARRHDEETKAAKDDKPTPYPTWDELRAEDREQKPKVVLTVRDDAGAVVRRVTGSTGKGLHRTTWDLRHAVPGGGRGPLAAPGRYSVSVATLIDGVLVEVAGPQRFDVARLPGAKFPAADPQAVLAFQTRAAALQRAVDTTVRVASDVGARIDAADAGILSTPGADREWLTDVHALREQLAELRVALEGDRTVSSRNEATPPSLTARARGALANFGSTGEPTQTHRDSYEIAAEQFDRVLSGLREVRRALEALEDRLEAAGGPTPTRKLPEWKK